MTDKTKVKCEICGREMSAGLYAHTIKCKREHGIVDEHDQKKEEEPKPEVKMEEKKEEPRKEEMPAQAHVVIQKEEVKKENPKEPEEKEKEKGDKQPVKGKSFLDEFLDEWV